MALIVLTSANGSPGVTTAALGLALAWPRPTVLVDADPTGASAVPAGYFHGQLPPGATVMDLAMSHRQGTLGEDLPGMLTPLPSTNVQLLRGTLAHTQARGLASIWEPLTGALRSLESTNQDVIVDAGRLGLDGFAMPLLLAADVALLTTRSHLPALVAANSWAQTLRTSFERVGATSCLRALVIGPGQPYKNRDVAKVLQIPVITSLAWDVESAEVLSRGATASRKYANAALPRSLRAAVQSIQSTVTASRAGLGLELTSRSQ